MPAMKPAIRGLHHAAYRCRDSEETRHFYEDFLGLPLAEAFEIDTARAGMGSNVLHSFYRLGDGSFIAFFEVPDAEFDFKDQHDFDLHIALEVDMDTLHQMFARGRTKGIETRGIADHGFVQSIYFRDPNGYVLELTAKTDAPQPDDGEASVAKAHAALHAWQAKKQRAG
jgi:catechol 2,3-dioxygenase-like lactoylglutathione lyase family enzyme